MLTVVAVKVVIDYGEMGSLVIIGKGLMFVVGWIEYL